MEGGVGRTACTNSSNRWRFKQKMKAESGYATLAGIFGALGSLFGRCMGLECTYTWTWRIMMLGATILSNMLMWNLFTKGLAVNANRPTVTLSVVQTAANFITSVRQQNSF